MKIQPGDRYTKDGVSVYVQDINGGEVLFRKWNSGVQRQPIFKYCYRLPIDKFQKAIRDAVKEVKP